MTSNSANYMLMEHVSSKNDDGCHYCRALHDIRGDGYIYCQSCPLFAGFLKFDKPEMEPMCLYYDFELAPSEGSALELYKYNDGLIASGLLPVFPDYIEISEQTKNISVIQKSIQYAASKHFGQKRKGSDVPYIAHPMEVMMLAATLTDNVNIIAAAALHDVLEDTDTSREELESEFGEEITEFVLFETENKRRHLSASDTWKIRKQEQIDKLISARHEEKIVMLCDKLSNMRATLRDYKASDGSDEIWDKFNMSDISEQKWYYESIRDALKDFSESPLYKEYCDILSVVFGNYS